MRPLLCLLTFLLLAWPTPAAAQEAEALRQRIAELEAEGLNNRARIAELGGGKTPAQSVNNLQTGILVLDDKIGRLTEVSEQVARSRDELEALQKQVAGEPIFTLRDMAEEGGEQGIEYGVKKLLEKAAKKGASKAVGPAAIAGDILEYGGKYVIRFLNERDILDIVRGERQRLIDVLRLIATLRHEQNEFRHRLAEIQDLRRRERRNLEEIAKARARLDELEGKATGDAELDRETDPEGDAELKRQALEDAVRLCNPGAREKPAGVRPATGGGDKSRAASEDAPPEDRGDCRLADGAWLLQWTATGASSALEIAYTGPEEPGPGAATYEMNGAGGQAMRCSAADYLLTCEVKLPPSAECPGLEWPWQKRWDMTAAEQGIVITGAWQPTIGLDVSHCAHRAPPPVPEFAFVLTPQDEGEPVSAK